MALRTPPSWLQNGSHPAENDRLSMQAIFSSSGTIGTGSLLVAQAASPAMAVQVAAGWGAIVGNFTSNMGVYQFYNDAATQLTVTTANPSNPRIDRVVVTISDAFYTGASNTVTFQVIAGTPAASPVAPATPIMSLSLATIAVVAGATSITNANITDTRVDVGTNLPVGDITSVAAGTGLSGGGTVGALTLTNSMQTTIDAAGDILYGSANDAVARLPIGSSGQILSVSGGIPAWINEVGDISSVNAGTGISGGGTSGDVTITNSMATAITTNGDLIRGTGAGTFQRLGVGTNGQVLTVVGGVPAYATPTGGSMTLLSTTTLTGNSVTVSSISQSYISLFIVLKNVQRAADSNVQLFINGASSAYSYGWIQNINAVLSANTNGNTSTFERIFPFGADGSTAAFRGYGTIDILRYTDSTQTINYQTAGGKSSNIFFGSIVGSGSYQGGPVTSITLTAQGTTFTDGVMYIYGVN